MSTITTCVVLLIPRLAPPLYIYSTISGRVCGANDGPLSSAEILLLFAMINRGKLGVAKVADMSISLDGPYMALGWHAGSGLLMLRRQGIFGYDDIDMSL